MFPTSMLNRQCNRASRRGFKINEIRCVGPVRTCHDRWGCAKRKSNVQSISCAGTWIHPTVAAWRVKSAGCGEHDTSAVVEVVRDGRNANHPKHDNLNSRVQSAASDAAPAKQL